MTFIEALEALQESGPSRAFLESGTAYTIVETLHVVGLAASVGLLAIADLRLAGICLRNEPVSESLVKLRPVMLAGFVLMIVTGLILFAPRAATLAVNPVFQIKLVLMLIAGVNAGLFEFRLGRRVATWGDAATPPTAARVAGVVSLVCWLFAILCGRWLAYGL